MNTLLQFRTSWEQKKRFLRTSLHHLKGLRDQSLKGVDREFSLKTYPHAQDIFNISNPLYVYEIQELKNLFCHDYVLARDGFFPLADFFFRFSRPGNSEFILLIHERLAFLVPEIWANNILTYNVQKKFDYKESLTSPESFYCCALTCDSDVRHQTFLKKISYFKETYGEELSKTDIKFALLLRGEPHFKPHKEVIHESFPLIKLVYAEFGFDQKLWTWEKMIREKDYHKSCYYYITDEYFGHAYSYIDHFFLSKRCMPFDDRFDQQKKGDVVLEVSPHYNIHINEFDYRPNGLWKEIYKMANFLGVAKGLSCSEFFPYSWKIAEEYLWLSQ